MKYRFRAAYSFWRSWSKLSEVQQQAARQAFPIFKANPFDPRLRAHKIHRLSAQYGRAIYAVDIAGDLRAAFYIEGETVWSVSIGTHDIYKDRFDTDIGYCLPSLRLFTVNYSKLKNAKSHLFAVVS